MKKTVLWLSRHEMTPEQEAYWKGIDPECEIVTKNVTWANSKDAVKDFYENSSTWHDLISLNNPVAITGVFPPVAMEAVTHKVQMFSPISRQEAKIREDGTKQIEFIHVRWSGNLNKNK